MKINLFLKCKILQKIFHEVEDSFDLELNFLDLDSLSKSKTLDVLIMDSDATSLLENAGISVPFIFLITKHLNVNLNENIYDFVVIKTPFKINDLMNRIVNHKNQKKIKEKKLIKLKSFTYDRSNRTLKGSKKVLRFTEKENEIFYFLLSNNDNSISKRELLKNIWKYDENIDTHTLETHIYSLRKKILTKIGVEEAINYTEREGYSINTDLL
tara:strand:- start:302 stop:940 length:639 start_codon:yes stop_codon:yes gene_type:complete